MLIRGWHHLSIDISITWRREEESRRSKEKKQGVKEDGKKTREEGGRRVIKMYVKGADNMIIQRLDQREKQVFLEKIQYRLDEFAKMGFRTLMVAYKEIGEKEYEEFETKLNALANVENREARNCKQNDGGKEAKRNFNLRISGKFIWEYYLGIGRSIKERGEERKRGERVCER